MSAMPNEERLAVFLNMAEADPDNELAHFSLGKIYSELGRHSEAEASLRRTLELNPQHSQAHRFLGESLLALGNRDAAIETLTRGVLLAHEKGEYQPRNQMQEILQREGVESPELPGGAAESPAGGGEADSPASEGAGFVCRRCAKPNPQLPEPPFTSDLGRQIHERICQPCWREWMAMSIKVINEYRLNLMDEQGNAIYDQHMREFLGLE